MESIIGSVVGKITRLNTATDRRKFLLLFGCWEDNGDVHARSVSPQVSELVGRDTCFLIAAPVLLLTWNRRAIARMESPFASAFMPYVM